MWCGRIKAASLLVAYRCAQVVSFLPLEIRVERTESVLLADLSVIVFSHTTNYLHVDAKLPANPQQLVFTPPPTVWPSMLAALLICAAHALAPVPDRATAQSTPAGPAVASPDPLARLQQNLADLEERTVSARAELKALLAQPGGGAGEPGAAAEHGAHGAARGLNEDGSSHTIFKMPDAFDLRFTIMTIFVLVVVTISFETVRKSPHSYLPLPHPCPRIFSPALALSLTPRPFE